VKSAIPALFYYLHPMDVQQELNKTTGFKNLQLLASQVVEGYISGMHKSPFHGFSAEFAEHKIYNYLPKQISFIPKDMKRKPTCVVILS
jgi:hypothetical protein